MLTYKGRKIYIESDGTPHGTHIVIDGWEQMTVTDCVVRINANQGAIEIETTMLDVGPPEFPSAAPKPWKDPATEASLHEDVSA